MATRFIIKNGLASPCPRRTSWTWTGISAGTAPSLAIDDLQAFGLRAPQPAARDRLTRAFEELYAGSATGLLSTSSREAFDAVQMLKRLDPGQYRPANGADYPRGR